MPLWTPSGDHRYVIEPQDPDRPQRLFDPQNGTLVEASGPTLCYLPTAHLDGDGYIQNTAHKAWVVQDTGWDHTDEPAFWGLMDQASDPEHPIWETALKHGYEEQRPASKKMLLAEIRDTEDPNKTRDASAKYDADFDHPEDAKGAP